MLYLTNCYFTAACIQNNKTDDDTLLYVADNFYIARSTTDIESIDLVRRNSYVESRHYRSGIDQSSYAKILLNKLPSDVRIWPSTLQDSGLFLSWVAYLLKSDPQDCKIESVVHRDTEAFTQNVLNNTLAALNEFSFRKLDCEAYSSFWIDFCGRGDNFEDLAIKDHAASSTLVKTRKLLQSFVLDDNNLLYIERILLELIREFGPKLSLVMGYALSNPYIAELGYGEDELWMIFRRLSNCSPKVLILDYSDNMPHGHSNNTVLVELTEEGNRLFEKISEVSVGFSLGTWLGGRLLRPAIRALR